jgi:hypothetical protein
MKNKQEVPPGTGNPPKIPPKIKLLLVKATSLIDEIEQDLAELKKLLKKIDGKKKKKKK